MAKVTVANWGTPQFLFRSKNDCSFADNPCISLSTMDPFKVGFLSKDDAKVTLLPVLCIVLALASERSSVIGSEVLVRRSFRLDVKDKFTTYAIGLLVSLTNPS